jgi:hypothetical protein
VTAFIRRAINYNQSGTTKDHLSLLSLTHSLIMRPLPFVYISCICINCVEIFWFAAVLE